MKLTPLDLRKQQFKKKFGGGYDPDEVRGFIEKLATDWEEVLESQRQAESRVREMEAKLKHYEKVELALQEALDQARETTRRAEDAADRRSKLIIEEAELRAQRMLQDAEQERYNIRQDLVKLNSRQAEIAARLRAFLMSEMEVLAHFQGEETQGFLKLMSNDQQALPGASSPPPASVVPSEAEVRPVEQSSLEADPTPAPEPAAATTPDPMASTPDGPATPSSPAQPEPSEAAHPATGPRRFTRPLDPVSEAPEPQPEPTTPAPDAEAPAPEPASRTYQDILSGKDTSSASSNPAPEGDSGSNPFSTPFFESPFFKKEETEPVAATDPSPSSDAAQGWSLRSLVTGEETEETGSVVATDDERERIRRILNDLD